MPKVATYSCAGCGAQKQQANHWWMIWTALEFVSIYRFDVKEDGQNREYYCGRFCAMKAIEAWMEKANV